jgi:hypothetical protein
MNIDGMMVEGFGSLATAFAALLAGLGLMQNASQNRSNALARRAEKLRSDFLALRNNIAHATDCLQSDSQLDSLCLEAVAAVRTTFQPRDEADYIELLRKPTVVEPCINHAIETSSVFATISGQIERITYSQAAVASSIGFLRELAQLIIKDVRAFYTASLFSKGPVLKLMEHLLPAMSPIPPQPTIWRTAHHDFMMTFIYSAKLSVVGSRARILAYYDLVDEFSRWLDRLDDQALLDIGKLDRRMVKTGTHSGDMLAFLDLYRTLMTAEEYNRLNAAVQFLDYSFTPEYLQKFFGDTEPKVKPSPTAPFTTPY